jgi:phospholipase C
MAATHLADFSSNRHLKEYWCMATSRKLLMGAAIVLCGVVMSGCRGLATETAGGGGAATQLTVTSTGPGSGTITSSPAGINCPTTCSAKFAAGTQVTLTATPGTSFEFSGWSGACSGPGACTVSVNSATTATANFSGTLQSINHVIFMLQENRGFTHYFGALREYWAANGFPDHPDFKGLPQFNTPAEPAPSNLGCDPNLSTATDCKIGPASPAITSFHMISQCIENPSPSWNESHVDWNASDPAAATPTMDGWVKTAGGDARSGTPLFSDISGTRAMGYYDGTDLPYYYFMASSFATSDMWFSPAISRTQPNRLYMMAATSAGRVYPLPSTMTQLPNKTIFESLQNKNVSWRVYVTDDQNIPLGNGTELGMFTFANSHLDHFAPASQFLTDLNTGNLPSVVEIDPGFSKATDEHPGTDPSVPAGRVQTGAAYVSSLINALMKSPYWKDSVFVLTWDEGGGFYDYVPPQLMPNPDGINPSMSIDLLPGDVCTNPGQGGPICELKYTGYRVPMMVISPYSKKNYLSHAPTDYTAILKLIEKRFNVSALTARDAAQLDMDMEFFDFSAPWLTPPPDSQIPVQPDTMPCYMDHLP